MPARSRGLGRDLSATVALSLALIRRMLREGLVMRSLVWPPALTAGTLMGTLVVLSLVQTSTVVAVPADAPPALTETILAGGWEVLPVDDPGQAVLDKEVWAGTDGATLWVRGNEPQLRQLEAALRVQRGSRWVPVSEVVLPNANETVNQGSGLIQVLTLLFVLYGVVFGLGMVARDRDDGTLEAELSLPIARWVPGAARWLAGTLVLCAFLGYAIALFNGLLGVPEAPALARHGAAAAGGSLSLGIGVIGGAGLKRGFSGPLAFGLTAATGLVALGGAVPAVGTYLPMCSVMAGGSGWIPLLLSLLSGVAASLAFAYRSAHA